jgi:hypothetical protein
MRVTLIFEHRVPMTFRLDPHNDAVQTPALLRGPPTDWWTVLANGTLPAAPEGSGHSVRHRPGVPSAPGYDEALGAQRLP